MPLAVATSPGPSPTPAPIVVPKQAHITLRASWVTVTNSLGDKTQNLVVHITSNLPMAFNGYPHILFRGQSIVEGQVTFATEVEPMTDNVWTLTGTRTGFPRGTYTVVLEVPSYHAGDGGEQLQGYVDWIGGEQGPLLRGNSQAIRDPLHPAVLDLRASLRVSHK